MSRGFPLLLALLAAPLAAAPPALRVKASPAVAPCVVAAGLEYERATGRRLAVETAAVGSPDSADGADVVVAADAGAQPRHRVRGLAPRARRGRGAHPVGAGRARRARPPRSSGPSAGRPRSCARSTASSPARPGAASGSRASPPRASSASARRRSASRPGEAAVVPLSLAGPGPVTALDVPPLSVHALGVRASPRKDAARAFLDFLAGETGNAAFRACGRTEAR